jgi:hypothetical protein
MRIHKDIYMLTISSKVTVYYQFGKILRLAGDVLLHRDPRSQMSEFSGGWRWKKAPNRPIYRVSGDANNGKSLSKDNSEDSDFDEYIVGWGIGNKSKSQLSFVCNIPPFLDNESEIQDDWIQKLSKNEG